MEDVLSRDESRVSYFYLSGGHIRMHLCFIVYENYWGKHCAVIEVVHLLVCFRYIVHVRPYE